MTKGKHDARGLIAYFSRAYPARSFAMVILLALSGLVEGVGVASLLPLLDLASTGPDGPGSSPIEAFSRSLAPHPDQGGSDFKVQALHYGRGRVLVS